MLYLTKPEFMDQCREFINKRDDDDDIDLIPILMFNDNEYSNEFWIEHVWIVTIDELENISIGISFKYNNEENEVRVSGIHLDRGYLMDQHELVLPGHSGAGCRCFDAFQSNINYLSIGNPDDSLNKIKYYKQQIEELSKYKEYINCLLHIDTNNINELQLFQKRIAAETNTKLPASSYNHNNYSNRNMPIYRQQQYINNMNMRYTMPPYVASNNPQTYGLNRTASNLSYTSSYSAMSPLSYPANNQYPNNFHT